VEFRIVGDDADGHAGVRGGVRECGERSLHGGRGRREQPGLYRGCGGVESEHVRRVHHRAVVVLLRRFRAILRQAIGPFSNDSELMHLRQGRKKGFGQTCVAATSYEPYASSGRSAMSRRRPYRPARSV
jgi:hypothetical protein